jgi:hypothetical protein
MKKRMKKRRTRIRRRREETNIERIRLFLLFSLSAHLLSKALIKGTD